MAAAWLALGLATLGAKPSSLIVTAHGLYGGACNLAVLEEALRARGGPDVLVHAATCNEGRTRDGVAAGGRRLADEVREVVRRHPTLTRLSLVGNSLGGLFVRFAAAELLDEAGTLAGLLPDSLVTIGCPHLGVSSFLYLPVPPPLYALGNLIAGKTAEDLLLRDAERPLLLRMAEPAGRFGVALRAFDRRRVYANLRGDAMVPFGTAAIEGGDNWGEGYRDESMARRFAELACRRGGACVDEAVLRGDVDGIAVVAEYVEQPAHELDPPSKRAPGRPGSVPRMTADMSARLNAAGWSKVAVSFRSASTPMPLAHNRIAALRREGWRQLFEMVERTGQGRPIMDHAAAYIVGVRSSEIFRPL